MTLHVATISRSVSTGTMEPGMLLGVVRCCEPAGFIYCEITADAAYYRALLHLEHRYDYMPYEKHLLVQYGSPGTALNPLHRYPAADCALSYFKTITIKTGVK